MSSNSLAYRMRWSQITQRVRYMTGLLNVSQHFRARGTTKELSRACSLVDVLQIWLGRTNVPPYHRYSHQPFCTRKTLSFSFFQCTRGSTMTVSLHQYTKLRLSFTAVSWSLGNSKLHDDRSSVLRRLSLEPTPLLDPPWYGRLYLRALSSVFSQFSFRVAISQIWIQNSFGVSDADFAPTLLLKRDSGHVGHWS